MRLQPTTVAVLLIITLSGKLPAQGPAGESPVPHTVCQLASEHDAAPSGPQISIAEVSFWGSLAISASEQTRVADFIKQQTHGTSLAGVIEEGAERARFGWQNYGYFKVEVEADRTVLTNSPTNQRIALRVRIDSGPQFTLGRITFRNNKVITDVDALRAIFPIKDGDIFSREEIAIGLENLRKAYGNLGYINFTAVPEPKVDEANSSIDLAIDFDEDKQFRVASVAAFGLSETARMEFLRDSPIKPGQIYSQQIWETAMAKYEARLPHCPCRLETERHIDEKSGSISLAFDFRPCTSDQ